MLKQKYFLTNFFILSAEKQPIKSSWRKIEWLHNQMLRTKAIWRFFTVDWSDEYKDQRAESRYTE